MSQNEYKWIECPICKGEGKLRTRPKEDLADHWKTCERCKGRGNIFISKGQLSLEDGDYFGKKKQKKE